jgi:hypothetical protein
MNALHMAKVARVLVAAAGGLLAMTRVTEPATGGLRRRAFLNRGGPLCLSGTDRHCTGSW